jgi:hypothetical protein
MAEIHRKRRFIGKLNQLLTQSIASGAVRTSIELARLIAVLECWTSPNKGTIRPPKTGMSTDQSESRLEDSVWDRLMSAAGELEPASAPTDPDSAT